MAVDDPHKLGEYDAILTIRIKTTDLWVPCQSISLFGVFYLLQLTKTTLLQNSPYFLVSQRTNMQLGFLGVLGGCQFIWAKKSPKWVFPKMVVPQNGWFIMENPTKMDDLGVPLFLETPKYWLSSCCQLLTPFCFVGSFEPGDFLPRSHAVPAISDQQIWWWPHGKQVLYRPQTLPKYTWYLPGTLNNHFLLVQLDDSKLLHKKNGRFIKHPFKKLVVRTEFQVHNTYMIS